MWTWSCPRTRVKVRLYQCSSEKGYCPDHVLMVGDAPGDCEAAADNGVYYYPILVKHEGDVLAPVPGRGAKRLVMGNTEGPPSREQMVRTFRDNLSHSAGIYISALHQQHGTSPALHQQHGITKVPG